MKLIRFVNSCEQSEAETPILLDTSCDRLISCSDTTYLFLIALLSDFEVIPPVQYSLNIIGPAHGSVTTPGEGRFFIYEEGTVVNLVAKPDSGYEFARWTGDVDTIANVNAASTTITMNGEYYICAHFREIPVAC